MPFGRHRKARSRGGSPSLHQTPPLSVAIDAHLRHVWPDAEHRTWVWHSPPLDRDLPGLRFRDVTPAFPGAGVAFATMGLSDRERHGERLELLLIAPERDAVHIETLAAIAHYHTVGDCPLVLGRTIDLGRPWMPGSRLDHLLVSLPYPFGPRLEMCERPPHPTTRILWLLAVHRSEADYAAVHGADALEALLDEHSIDLLDGDRDPVT